MKALMLALLALSMHAETIGLVGASVQTGVSISGKPAATRPLGNLVILRSITPENFSMTTVEPSAAGASTITGFARRFYSKGKLSFWANGQGGMAGAEEGLAGLGGGGGFALVEFRPDWFAMVGGRFDRKSGVNGGPASNQTVISFGFGGRF